MVRQIYKRYERPLVRVVHGSPTSWGPVVAAMYDADIHRAVWSPCNRFIAVTKKAAAELRDAVTLALLNTFECPSPEPLSLNFSPDSRLLAGFTSGRCTSWDLRTGGSVEVGINLPDELYAINSNFIPVYSTDAKMIAVVSADNRSETVIITFDLFTRRAHLHPVSEGRVIPPIWTRGEFLRFATVEPGHITIWEANFTFTHPPKAVESLPTLDDISAFARFLFLPTHSRLAIASPGTLLVWHARDSKLLLKISDSDPSDISFSSDGRFFACLFRPDGEVRVWKESLSCYILHQRLMFSSLPRRPGPFLSPDGTSGIICSYSTVRLWHTKHPVLPSHPIPAARLHREFVLEFSPCGTLAAFTRELENTVTVLNLQSSGPQLVVDADMEVRSLGVTGSTIVVVGRERIIAWNVVAGNARAGINDSVRIVTFDSSPPSFFGPPFLWMSTSPDLSRIVALGFSQSADRSPVGVQIYDMSTGRCLAGAALDIGMLKSLPVDSRLLIQAKVHTHRDCGSLQMDARSGAHPSMIPPCIGWKSLRTTNPAPQGCSLWAPPLPQKGYSPGSWLRSHGRWVGTESHPKATFMVAA